MLAGDEVLATAILDRLLRYCRVLQIDGRSFRLRDLEQQLGPGPMTRGRSPLSTRVTSPGPEARPRGAQQIPLPCRASPPAGGKPIRYDRPRPSRCANLGVP